MSEFEAKHYLAELLVAIEELHKNGIIHRDIKPENVLIDVEGHIKLSDFGLAKVGVFAQNLTRTELGGGLTYKIPEVVMQKPYGQSVDLYLYGLLAYEMLLGVPAFPCTESEEEQEERIRRGVFELPDEILSESAISLLQGTI